MASKSSKQSSEGSPRLIPLGSHAGVPPIDITRPATVIGSRKEAVRLHLESSTVSKAHCVLVMHDWGCTIHDLASRTHTIVNGQPIVDADLSDGDKIQIGRFEFQYDAGTRFFGEPVSAPAAALEVSTLSEPLQLNKRVIQVGRRKGSDLEFDDKAVSNIHAIIFERNGKRYIRDLVSRTGTWLEGKPIHQAELQAGMLMKIGAAEIAYREVPVEQDDFAPIMLPLEVEDEIAPQIDEPIEAAPIDEPLDLEPVAPAVDDEIGLELVNEAPADEAIPAEDAPLEIDLDAPAIADDEDGLTGLRRGWRGASGVPEDEVADLVPLEPVGEEPVAETPGIPEPVVELPVEEPAIEEPLAELPPLELPNAPAAPSAPAADADLAELLPDDAASEEPFDLAELDDLLAAPVAETPVSEEPITQAPITQAPIPESHLADAHFSEVPVIKIPELTETEEPVTELPPHAPEADLPLILEPEPESLIAEAHFAETPIAEVPVEDPISGLPSLELETPADEPFDLADLDDLLLEPEPVAPVETAKVVEETPVAEAPVEEPKAEELPVLPEIIEPEAEIEAPAEPLAIEPLPSETASEAEVEPLDLEELSFAETPADGPIDLDEIENLLLEPAAETPKVEEPIAEAPIVEEPIAETPASESTEEFESPAISTPPPLSFEDAFRVDSSIEQPEVEAELEIPKLEPIDLDSLVAAAPDVIAELPVDESTDDDGAIDYSEAPAAPVAESIVEPDLNLEADDAGLDLGLPSLPTFAEADVTTPIESESPRVEPLSIETVDETVQVDAPLTEDEILGELHGTPFAPELVADDAEDEIEIAEAAPIGELPTAPLPPEPVDLSSLEAIEPPALSPLPPVIEGELSDWAEEPAVAAEADAVDLNQDEIIEDAVVEDANEDTAFAVGLDDLDPFDMDDEGTFVEPAVPVAQTPVAEVPSAPIPVPPPFEPVSIAPIDEEPVDATDEVDISEIMAELGIAEDDVNLPPAAAASAIDEVIDPIVAETEIDPPVVDEDVAPVAEIPPEVPPAPVAPPRAATLADLIPKQPPMIGGFFAPQGGMMVGGSPMVNLNAPPPVRASPPPPPQRQPMNGQNGLLAPPSNQPFPPVRRPQRVGFGAAPAGPAASPFAGDGKTIADVLIGRKANQSVDVFASPSPTQADLKQDAEAKLDQPADGNAPPASDIPQAPIASTPEEEEILRTADRYRPRGTIRALTDPVAADEQPAPPPQPQPEDVAMMRKSRLRRVFFSGALLLPLVAGAGYVGWSLFPSYSKLDATITYPGLEGLSEKDGSQLRKIQENIVDSDSTLTDAVSMLDPKVTEQGFLLDSQKSAVAITKEWPEKPGNTLHLVTRSTNKEEDELRLRALAGAVIKANSPRANQARELRKNIDEDTRNIESLTKQKQAINDELQAIAAAGENRPGDDAIAAAGQKAKAAESDLRTIKSERSEAEAAIEAIKKQPFTSLVPVPDEQFYQADEELKKLAGQIDDLQKKDAEARAAVDARVAAARKSLDQVIQQFQTNIDSVQKAGNIPPAMAKYVEGAQRVFKQTRQLTDELLSRQEQMHTRLIELKSKLSGKNEEHTRDILEKDPELKKLNDELAILTRQRNAIADQDMPKEQRELSLKMDLLKSLISGREELVKHDPIYEETITSLAAIIEQTEKTTQDDRKHVDETLSKTQEDFARSAPEMQSLSPELQKLATAIDQRMTAVAEARKAYSTAADAADAENARREADLKARIAEIQAAVRTRRTAVLALARDEQSQQAEVVRKKLLDEKSTALAAVQAKEATLQAAFDAATSEQQKMQDQRRKLVESDLVRAEKEDARRKIDTKIRMHQTALIPKKSQLASLVIPDEKYEFQSYDDSQTKLSRPAIAGIAAGGMFLLMLIPIAWNLLLISRESHAAQPVNGFRPVISEDDFGAKTSSNGRLNVEPVEAPAMPHPQV